MLSVIDQSDDPVIRDWVNDYSLSSEDDDLDQ